MITGTIKPNGSDIEAIQCISDDFVKIFVKFSVKFSKSKIKVSEPFSHFKPNTFVTFAEYCKSSKSSGNLLNNRI